MSFKPVKVKADDKGQRLDRWIKKHFPVLGYGGTQKAIRKGEVRINGKRCKGDENLAVGDEVRLPPYAFTGKPSVKKARISEKDVAYIKSLILFEDQDIIALNKPSGLATQGGSGIKKHVDGMLDALINKKTGARPKLVHRLDKDTSGILILAKTADSARHLQAAFKGRDIKKTYLAVTIPAPSQKEGEIRGALEKQGGKGRERVQVDDDHGKSARTLFQVLDVAGKAAALVAFSPLTGRTHQIRVHAGDILECPIIGDFKYGFQKEALADTPIDKSLHLHAFRLSIPKPRGGEWSLQAPLSKHMADTLSYFSFNFIEDMPIF